MRKVASQFLFCISLLFLNGCAIQVAPQGGEKDVTPPVLKSVQPPSGSLNFSGNSLEFEFDENIQVKDIASKLVVSPPLKQLPMVKSRKNKLLVTFDDTLHPATTYTFNFGDAIVDLNEGNAFPDLQYVVSTGSYIDTLNLYGVVSRAEDLQPEKGMLVMLYPGSAADSAPYLERPSYFSKTNSSGKFSINNLAAGNYRLFGLLETNQNYRYDDPAERIAFMDSLIALPDSGIQLYSFRQYGPTELLKSSAEEPGKIRLIFNQPFPKAKVRCLNATNLQLTDSLVSAQRDTLTFWYTNLSSDTAAFIIDYVSTSDTILLQLKKYEPKPGKKTNFQLQVSALNTNALPVVQPLQLTTNHPVKNIGADYIILRSDTARIKDALSLSVNQDKTTLLLSVNWMEDSQYSLQLLPGAFTDIFGLTNDTVEQPLTIRPATAFGTLRVQVSGSLSSTQSLLLLVDEKDAVVRQAIFSSDTTAYFDYLLPGTYRLKWIDDTNANGRWDEGNYLLHRQPEAVRYYDERIPVRANWDVEIKWNRKK